jgi:hypothetical protein
MELRLDRLLAALRADPTGTLAGIDADPLLVKRESAGLVLANAAKGLFTPQEPHQLFAKGIVYRRDPYRLVSLPLVKIYNLGERNVSVADLIDLCRPHPGGPEPRLHFLRKFDGSLVQRFAAAGRVWFTTRGMIEGAVIAGGPADDEADERRGHFDYLGGVRSLAARKYPALLEDRPDLAGLSLVFEFLHPDARVVTDYGTREDLVLLAAFDQREWRYRTYAELRELADAHGLTAVDDLAPAGNTVAEQIDDLLAALRGTDQEGSVITIEHGHQVVYRVKVKSPDYLRLMKLMANCTYAATVEMIDAHPEWAGWPDLEAHLKALGREKVPEEVLAYYREHYEAFAAYRADCGRLIAWADATAQTLKAAADGTDPRMVRKAFAEAVRPYPHKPLLFLGFDGRLDFGRVRQVFPTPDEARAAVRGIEGASS